MWIVPVSKCTYPTFAVKVIKCIYRTILIRMICGKYAIRIIMVSFYSKPPKKVSTGSVNEMDQLSIHNIPALCLRIQQHKDHITSPQLNF